MQAPVAVRCLWTNCYTLPLPFYLSKQKETKITESLLCHRISQIIQMVNKSVKEQLFEHIASIDRRV